MTSRRTRVIGIASLASAVVVAMIAFGIMPVWPYDTDASYQAYVDGRYVGDARSGAAIVSQNNSATSLLIVPLLVVGISMLRMSRADDKSRATAPFTWPAAAIAGAAAALIAYVGFFAQFVEQGDFWLGNPFVVLWLSPVLMVVTYILLKLPSESGPRTEETARQGLTATLALAALGSVLIVALMTYGAIDGFVPLGVAIAVSALMLGMTAALGVVLMRHTRRH